MKKSLIFTLLALLCLSFTANAAAPLPTSVDVLDRERQSLPEPLSQPKIIVEEPPKQEAAEDTSQPFILEGLVVKNTSFFTSEELTKPYAQFYGKEVTFNQIMGIANDMTKRYRDAGHVLTRVIVPEQEGNPEGMVVTLQAVEGFVDEIAYQGDEKLVEQFKSYFSKHAQKILAMRPLNHIAFERYMLLAQDTPGLEVATSFSPSEQEQGASKLLIELDRKIVSGNVGVNNTGTDSSGPIMLNGGLAFNSFPLLGLEANINYGQAADFDEYHYWQAGGSYRFANGLTFTGNYGQSFSPNPDTAFARLFGYETSSEYFAIGASYPLLRSRDANLTTSLTYNHRNSDSRLLNAPNTRDKTRNLTLSFAYDVSDVWGGLNQVVVDYAHGLDWAGASDHSPTSGRSNAGPDYNKFTLFLSRTQQLPENFSLYLAAQGQTADDRLFSYDQFSLGGSQFGRGYDGGVVSGDQGMAAAAELRWTYPIKEDLGLQPFIFYDWGKTRFLKSSVEPNPWTELSSVGVGVNVWGDIMDITNFNASFFVAKPLQRVLDTDTDDWRAVFQLSFSF